MASAYKTEFARNLVDILYIKKLMGKRENKNKTKNIFSNKGKKKKSPACVLSSGSGTLTAHCRKLSL